ncbi:hypothetical protein HU200_017548 [Digitaria exilis]|uniref:FAS1 domain-containing protein n=1 Tax=Digitaria exilis TaxID=1010633 RepID=A0A835F6C2_9POAL|nr:hypothetical protein HU200_017548 [Digitaria exilis]
MPLVPARSVLLLFATAVAMVATSPPPCLAAHNITAILSGRRDLSEFSRELTATGLADDIDGRNTITVLAVDDARMAALKARGLPRETLRHVLSLHVLVDYYDDAKLHALPGGSADVSTLFQASGDAPGNAGMVEISDRRGGRVSFVPQDGGASAAVFYVKPVHQTPYNISVLQVSGVLSSPAAEAPASPEASSRIDAMDVMSKTGCGRFAGLVGSTAGAASAFGSHTHSTDGFTLFCPDDKAVEAFEPAFKKLSSDARLAVVLYHGVAGHFSLQGLRSHSHHHDYLKTLSSLDDKGNGTFDLMLLHDGDKATLVSETQNEARVTRTLADAYPVAVYMIDAVLVPFNSDGDSGRKDGGDGRQTSGAARGSAPWWPPRGWVASAALVFTLVAAFPSG